MPCKYLWSRESRGRKGGGGIGTSGDGGVSVHKLTHTQTRPHSQLGYATEASAQGCAQSTQPQQQAQTAQGTVEVVAVKVVLLNTHTHIYTRTYTYAHTHTHTRTHTHTHLITHHTFTHTRTHTLTVGVRYRDISATTATTTITTTNRARDSGGGCREGSAPLQSKPQPGAVGGDGAGRVGGPHGVSVLHPQP